MDWERTKELTSALLTEGITVIPRLAPLTVEAKGVEEALLALPCPRVTVARTGDVNIVVAVTGLALAARNLRVAIVVISTHVTARSWNVVLISNNLSSHYNYEIRHFRTECRV